MGHIIRVKVNWSGFVGAPGYTNLYFEPVPESDTITQPTVDAAVGKVQTFLGTWRQWLPTVVTTGVDSTVEELDEVTGALIGFWSATVAAPAGGSGSTAFASPAGACISWGTQGVRNGRRVRGRTFMVPLASSAYDTDGTIHGTHLPVMRTAANTLHVDSNGARLVVWARPNGSIIPDGGAYDVITANITDKVAMLTSRRD